MKRAVESRDGNALQPYAEGSRLRRELRFRIATLCILCHRQRDRPLTKLAQGPTFLERFRSGFGKPCDPDRRAPT
jgi:hypothetical protein